MMHSNTESSFRRISQAIAVVMGVSFLFGCAPERPQEEPPLSVRDIVTDEKERISTNPLRLEDAVRLGILSSTNVLTSDIAFEQSGNDAVIARAAFFPELYVNVAPSTSTATLMNASAGIRYTLYDFGERAALLDAATAGIKRARYTILSEIDESVLETVGNYIDVAADVQQTRAAKALLDNIDELEDGVRARVEIGVASNIDLNEIETGRLKATANIVDAEADEKNSREALSSRLGVEPRSVAGLATLDKKLAPRKSSKDLELEDYPKVAALTQQLAETKANLKAAEAGRFPKIGLQLGVGVDVTSSAGLGTPGIIAGPQISDGYSLGGGRKERIRNAELDVLTAFEQLEEEKRLTRLDLKQARTSAAASRSQLEKRREVLKLSKESRDVMLGEYEIGSRSLRDLIEAEERIYEAQVDLNETFRIALKDRLRVLKAINALSESLYKAPK